MPTIYTIAHYDPWGVRLPTPGLDQYVSLAWTRTENDVGALTLVLPPVVRRSTFSRDQLLAVYEHPEHGGPARLADDTIWFIQKARRRRDASGELSLVVTTVDANVVLRRRIIPQYAGSSAASKTGALDDIMKAVVREQIGALTGPGRGTPLLVEADTSAAPTDSRAFAYETVLDMLQDTAALSARRGVYCGFEVRAAMLEPRGVALTFRTYTGQRGTDRSSQSRQRLLIGEDYGNLINTDDEEDASDLATVVYAGGRGEGAERIVEAETNDALAAIGPWSRIEVFHNATQAESRAAVLAEAGAELAERHIRRYLAGELVEQPGLRYGVDLHFGDLLTAEIDGEQFDARLSSVTTTIAENGEVRRDLFLRGTA